MPGDESGTLKWQHKIYNYSVLSFDTDLHERDQKPTIGNLNIANTFVKYFFRYGEKEKPVIFKQCFE